MEGPMGQLGFQGDPGPQGEQGIQGPTGQQGIQGVTGSQGIQGVTGLIGPMGQQGIQGVTGQQGIQGVTGSIGPMGQQGIQGVTGQQGIQGVTGSQGIQGVTGSQGIQGVTGPQGQAGSLGLYTISSSGTTLQSGVAGLITLSDNTSNVYLLDKTQFPTNSSIDGITNTGVNGRVITLVWTKQTGVADNIIFTDKNNGASAGQQFYLSGVRNVNVGIQGTITFVYVSALSPGYWVQIGMT
jgi:hypothetical protein